MKLLILFLFAVNTLFAQNCKYKRNEIDEFTKKKILQTERAFVNRSMGFVVHFDCLKINENKFITFDIGNGAELFATKKDDKMMLLASNGDVVEFTFDESKISHRTQSTPETISYTFPLDDTTLTQLSTLVFSKIRIYTTKGYIEKDIKAKNWIEAQQIIKCIL